MAPRRVTLLVALVLSVALIGCGDKAGSSASESSQLEGAQSKAQEAVSKSEVEKKAAEAQSAGPEGG